MSILIRNGQLLLEKRDTYCLEVGDIRIEDGVIQNIAKTLVPKQEEKIIDASGKFVAPGLIDLHVHLREPGREDKETIVSGAKAGAAGGFTTIVCMPNTEPPLDSGPMISAIYSRALEAPIRVIPVGCVSKGRKGKELAEIGELVETGVWGISDDGDPVMNSELMRRALEYSRPFNIPVISHAEDPNLTGKGVMHEGFISTILGLQGIPAEAESVMVARDVLLAKATGGWLHIAHVSTKESLELIRVAKAEGAKITCEVTPHHLILTDEALMEFDTNTKVNPPLRSRDHVDALRGALVQGVIDCIATDHAPHTWEEKDCDFDEAEFGLIGLETALPALLTHLVQPGLVDLFTLWDRMSYSPARLLGLKDHGLKVGNRADVIVVDYDLEKVVDPAKGQSLSTNTPFQGQKLKGWPVLTIANGEIVFTDL